MSPRRRKVVGNQGNLLEAALQKSRDQFPLDGITSKPWPFKKGGPKTADDAPSPGALDDLDTNPEGLLPATPVPYKCQNCGKDRDGTTTFCPDCGCPRRDAEHADGVIASKQEANLFPISPTPPHPRCTCGHELGQHFMGLVAHGPCLEPGCGCFCYRPAGGKTT